MIFLLFRKTKTAEERVTKSEPDRELGSSNRPLELSRSSTVSELRNRTSTISELRSNTVSEIRKPKPAPAPALRLRDRIRSLQAASSTKDSRPTTLPWNKVVSSDTLELQKLRKTSSSPCLFLHQTTTQPLKPLPKKPLKLFAVQLNQIESKLSQVTIP